METKTLQKYTEDPDKLERLLKAKKEKRTSNTHGRYVKRVVTEEIEMLKVILCLVRCDARIYASKP